MLPDRDSIAAFTEADLAEWLLGSDGAWAPPRPQRRLAQLVLSIPTSAPVRFRIPTGVLVSGATAPGDVDALVAAPGEEAHAVAFECKPVKVKAATFATGRPNRFPELEHGAGQANALHALGLHRTYLLVAVAIDGRERPGNWLDRGLSAQLQRAIYGSLPLDLLHPGVGLVVAEGVQPSGKSVYLAAGVGLPIIREAMPQVQPPALTAAIRRMFTREVVSNHDS